MKEEERECDKKFKEEVAPAILVKNIRKVYGLAIGTPLIAVSDVSFFVEKGKIFALLGTNGAGKTTTFKMLTSDVIPTKGNIYINGLELNANFSKIRKMIGYCPQYEAAFMPLTTRENLQFYAKVKGVNPELRETLITKIIEDMQLGMYEDVQAGSLSGGNKRKLTVAIAILGNPPIVLLDEPSTGVDPQAKRFMWKVIKTISERNNHTAVVLTTHSMEEAEALCSKMAIMVAGTFRCIGSPEKLKQTYGEGFEIQITIKPPSEEIIKSMAASWNLHPSAQLSMPNLVQIFQAYNMADLIQEISANGYAADFYREFTLGKGVSQEAVANFLLVEMEGRKVAWKLASVFGKVTIPEHYNNYFKFRVDRKENSSLTIGSLFIQMQDLSTESPIEEFAVSQTSLSQIFHSFVQQAEVVSSIIYVSMAHHLPTWIEKSLLART